MHAHRAPDGGCLRSVLVGLAAIGGLVVLCGASLAECDDAPANQHQGPRPTYPRQVPPDSVPSWAPARRGDVCSPSGAVWHSSTGVTLTCGRWRGLGYDTWG